MAEGQTLDLTCVVPGQAHAQVTWHRRGASLPARHQVRGLEKAECGHSLPYATPCLGNPAGMQPQRGGGPKITGNQKVKNRLGTAGPPLVPQHLGGN